MAKHPVNQDGTYDERVNCDDPECGFCRHQPVYAQTNPETGRKAYPATTPDGYPVLADGSVAGCDCERCEDRRDLDMATDESQPTEDANYCLGTERCPDCETLVEVWDNQRGDYTLRIDIATRGGQEHSC